jgi:hypothetical protein
MIFNAHDSYFSFINNAGIINDYYQNIVSLIQKIIENNPKMKVNINLYDDYNFNNDNVTLKIGINYEHTLVKSGGRSVHCGTPFGDISYDINKMYLVRIVEYDKLMESDIIVDYSNPNIHNVRTCPIYDSFSKKHIYISSSIFEPHLTKDNRNIITLTTFINTNEERREKLLNKIYEQKIEHININNCFDKDTLQSILKNTKILINIHQTPHHDTFEELRVLPALECGVIVISEQSPLIETIPYKDLIIWTKYEDIIDKVKEVITNYVFFHDKIFTTENINKLLCLQKINYDVLEKIIVKKALDKVETRN